MSMCVSLLSRDNSDIAVVVDSADYSLMVCVSIISMRMSVLI
jgi:hypothetical protein